jgi:hypothetical protein
MAAVSGASLWRLWMVFHVRAFSRKTKQGSTSLCVLGVDESRSADLGGLARARPVGWMWGSKRSSAAMKQKEGKCLPTVVQTGSTAIAWVRVSPSRQGRRRCLPLPGIPRENN